MGLKQKSTMLAMYMNVTLLIWSLHGLCTQTKWSKNPTYTQKWNSMYMCKFWVDSQFNVLGLNVEIYMLTIWTTLGTPNQKELQRVPRTLSSVHRKNGPQGG